MKINAFCTPCQKEEAHEVTMDLDGELVLTCPCKHFIKVPAGTAPEQIKAYLDEHKAQNKDRVFLNAAEEKRKTEAKENYLKDLMASGVASPS